MLKLFLTSALAISISHAQPAAALINIIGEETGGNVEFSYSGSLNVAGLTTSTSVATPSAIVPNIGAFGFRTSSAGSNDFFENSIDVTSPIVFGGGGTTFSDIEIGDIFGLRGSGQGQLFLPLNYVSGTNISGAITFNSATFASLGVTPGTYNYNLTNGLDSIALNIGVTPVPFEFSPALGLGVLGGLVVAKKLSGKFFKK